MNFEFATAGRIIFGPGSSAKLAELAGTAGKRGFLITGRSGDHYDRIQSDLSKAGLQVTRHTIHGEPTVEVVEEVLEAARHHRPDTIVAVGGGSVLDTGKVVAGLMTNPGELSEYLEVVGAGKPLSNPALPFCAVPTTAGTGTEVTRNAVIGVPEHKVKVSVRSAFLLPKYAVVDPELTLTSPPPVTAASGLDACTQLLETYVAKQANPMTDAVCREGLVRVGRSLRTAYHEPENRSAREDMALAALMSGIALANSKLGAVHGFAGPLGGLIAAPHGALCARLLGPVTRANLGALQSRDPESLALVRYRQATQLLIGDSDVQAGDLIDWAVELTNDLGIPSLGELGLHADLISEAVGKAQRASSMKGNPIELTEAELRGVLEQAL